MAGFKTCSSKYCRTKRTRSSRVGRPNSIISSNRSLMAQSNWSGWLLARTNMNLYEKKKQTSKLKGRKNKYHSVVTPDHHRRNLIISDKKNVTKGTRGIHCMQLFLNINQKCELTRRQLNWKNLKELTCVKIHQFCREKRSMCFSGPHSSFPKESKKHFTKLRRARKNAGDQITIGFGMERFWIE